MPTELQEALADFEGLPKLYAHGVKNVEDLATRFIESRTQIDSTMRAPQKDAPAEEWNSFYSKMGRPETHEGYEVPGGGSDQFKQIAERIRKVCHDQGLSAKQYAAIMGTAAEVETGHTEGLTQQVGATREQWLARGKERFGADFDGMREKAQAQLDAMIANDPTFGEFINASPIKDHPDIMALLVAGQQYHSPGRIPVSGAVGPAGAPQGAQIMAEAQTRAIEARAIAEDPDFLDQSAIEHETKSNRWWELQKEIQLMGFKGCTDPRLEKAVVRDQHADEFAAAVAAQRQQRGRY